MKEEKYNEYMGMEYITEETVNKLRETIKNKPYICNYSLENEVIKEMLDILHDDTKFQEFQKQIMDKIILGEI